MKFYRWLALLLALQGVLISAAGAARLAQGEKTPTPAAAVESIIGLTNQFRKGQGRQEVKANPQLTATARQFADFMARTDKFGHTADGSRPADRAKAHGYDYCVIAENIAYQYSSAGFSTEALAKGFVEGWENSPEHRKNMLDPAVTETGVAIARSGQTGTYYAVQLFGRPRSSMVTFQVANQSQTPIQYQADGKSWSLPPGYIRTHGQCRPSELIVQWPNGRKNTSIQPDNGAHYVIQNGKSEAFELTKE
jgi:uncharacterized protein YkwD